MTHPIQLFIAAFVSFAISRVVMRYREGKLPAAGTAAWAGFWLIVGVVSLLPQVATLFARLVGVGRGVDAVMYVAILSLFYGIFRMFVRIEQLEHQITLVVRDLALKERAEQAKQSAVPPVVVAAAAPKVYAQEGGNHHRHL